MRRHHFSRVPDCICVVNYEEQGQKCGTQSVLFWFFWGERLSLEDEREMSPHVLAPLMSIVKSLVRLHSAAAPFLPHCLYFPLNGL